MLIEGHTDSVGKDDYNMVLSRKRADSVKYKLMEDGIEAGRIATVGYGESSWPATTPRPARRRTVVWK